MLGINMPQVDSHFSLRLSRPSYSFPPYSQTAAKMNDIQITDVTENSARLRWASPEPHSAYVFDLTITLAHDHSLVLKQNVTGTERVIGGLRSGQKYLVFITGYLKSQPKVTYTGTFSTSEFISVKYQHSLLFFPPLF